MGPLSRCGSILLGATLLGILMSACVQSRGRTPALRDTVIIGIADTAAHLRRDVYFGPRERARRVIREQRDLDELWGTLQAHMPAPRVDFLQEDVLVAAFGIYGSVALAISIDTVLTRGAERIVVVRVTDVNERCLTASSLTAPIDIVVVPHERTRTTQFLERRDRLPGCEGLPRSILRSSRP